MASPRSLRACVTPGVDVPPLVIAHRGASGYRPEHTLPAYELAARMGADYLEPDLVCTADGVLIARHEPQIGRTTDVAARPEFADRHTTKKIDGVTCRGWFAEDFTLAELKTLRAVERMPQLRRDNAAFDGLFEIPTFSEILELRHRLSQELGRQIGVYPETKNPRYFAGLGRPLEPALVAALQGTGLNHPDRPVFVQSFDATSLRELRHVLQVPLVQLVDTAWTPAGPATAGAGCTASDLATPVGLAEIATYADVVALNKEAIIARRADGTLGPHRGVIEKAHAAELLVHCFTFRNENHFLPTDLRSSVHADEHGDASAEYQAFLRAGVDGVFSDNPDTAVMTVSAHRDSVRTREYEIPQRRARHTAGQDLGTPCAIPYRSRNPPVSDITPR
jgi:glycerophosphoryl diester phosphodiesterase